MMIWLKPRLRWKEFSVFDSRYMIAVIKETILKARLLAVCD